MKLIKHIIKRPEDALNDAGHMGNLVLGRPLLIPVKHLFMFLPREQKL